MIALLAIAAVFFVVGFCAFMAGYYQGKARAMREAAEMIRSRFVK